MKLSFSKLIFETFYLLTILIVGVGSGLFVSKMGYLVTKAGFIDGILNSTIMNEHGFYEMTPPTTMEE